MLSPELLLLALVPQTHQLAFRLLTERGALAVLDESVISALLAPSAQLTNPDEATRHVYPTLSSWQWLQLDPDSTKLVHFLMRNVPALASLDVLLNAAHAARAADLLMSEVPLSDGAVDALLIPHASPATLRQMPWDEAASSPGAVVYDSPHPYPPDAFLTEPISVPGAARVYVAFHEQTRTERSTSVTLRWQSAHDGAQHTSERYAGAAAQWPGAGKMPVLEIPADTLELRFESGRGPARWGYRMVVWSRGPPAWCRFSELMLHDSKDADLLCRTLLTRSPRLAAFAAGEMVKIALNAAANNPKRAPAAAAVLGRVATCCGDAARREMSDVVCDMLLRPSEGGTTPWEKLLISNASPKLTKRLMRTPRLATAAQSLELLLKALVPKHRDAAQSLMRLLPSLPQGLTPKLLERDDETGRVRWAELVRDARCSRLVRTLLQASATECHRVPPSTIESHRAPPSAIERF